MISRFGIMFFADLVAAFTNLRRATRPFGWMVFVCWQDLTAKPVGNGLSHNPGYPEYAHMFGALSKIAPQDGLSPAPHKISTTAQREHNPRSGRAAALFDFTPLSRAETCRDVPSRAAACIRGGRRCRVLPGRTGTSEQTWSKHGTRKV